MSHVMQIVETFDDGLHRLECDQCEMMVYAKPGYTKIVRYGANVPHMFAALDEPIPAPELFAKRPGGAAT